jgi:non-haem Fe2+, alpha-ketoglutarate-dependent halogenase
MLSAERPSHWEGNMKALSQAQVDSFHYHGFLFPIPALSSAEIATCLAGLQRLEAELGSPVAEADIKWRSHAYAHSPWFNDLIRHPRILDAIEDVIGPDIVVWTSTFFIKEPRSPTFAAWHQDGTYFGLEPKAQVCAWVALTDAGAEAGCMEMLSSRGTLRQRHHAALGLPNSINRAGQTIMEPLGDTTPVAMALRAGEFSLHHELAVHRSAPNNASHRRVGIGLNYIPTHVRAVGWPGAAQGDAGARRGPLRTFWPDRSAGSGA